MSGKLASLRRGAATFCTALPGKLIACSLAALAFVTFTSASFATAPGDFTVPTSLDPGPLATSLLTQVGTYVSVIIGIVAFVMVLRIIWRAARGGGAGVH